MKKFLTAALLLLVSLTSFADEPLLDNEPKFSVSNGTYKVVFTYTNLIPVDYNINTVLFTVYKNGSEYDTVAIKEVIRNPRNLQRTVSHYYWGTCKGIYEKGIVLDTIEGYKIYNFEQKKFLALNDRRNAAPWSRKELLHHSLELINTTGSIENYSYFDYDSKVGQIVGATYGRIETRPYSPNYKKAVSLTSPLLYWSVNSEGVLSMAYDSSNMTRNPVMIYKIFIDEKNETLFAIQNNRFVKYKYVFEN